MLFVACWLCSTTVYGVAAPKGPLQSHITGGYKGLQMRNSRSDLDCSQFESDYDVLYHFSFQIMINPINSNWQKSIAHMDGNATFVDRLELRNENAVQLSIFCLKNLRYLTIQNMPFPDGIVPDNLVNLKQLDSLYIYNSAIVNMTERLGTLSNLQYLYLHNCSLTSLPNLSGLPQLIYVSFYQNRLSKVDGLTSVINLELNHNLFTDIPTLKTPSTLRYLFMDHNPLKNMLKITSHTNLYWVSLKNTTLSSIPPTIDRLQKLYYLDLSDNKLFYLPTNILNLVNLRHLLIRNNLFTSGDIETFKTRFNMTHPSMTLDY